MNRREFIINSLIAAAAAGAGIANAAGNGSPAAEKTDKPAKNPANSEKKQPDSKKDKCGRKKKMKILVITGSPRKKGNSSILADSFIKGAEEAGHTVYRFDAAFKKVHPCIACDHCGMDGPCIFKRISGWSAGVFAIVALLHDLIIVFGTFVLCGFELDANFVAVILTILGYSVNDTIVVYDRIRENQSLLPNTTPLPELVNISLSQTMRRTIRTSITTIAAMLIVTILATVNHVDSILRFSIPMTVGMISGCYSSLALAPTLWTAWKTREKAAEE